MTYCCAPVKVSSIRARSVVSVDTSKLSEVARTAPVGVPPDPNVPV